MVIYSGFTHKIVIFNSYVSLPEGNSIIFQRGFCQNHPPDPSVPQWFSEPPEHAGATGHAEPPRSRNHRGQGRGSPWEKPWKTGALEKKITAIFITDGWHFSWQVVVDFFGLHSLMDFDDVFLACKFEPGRWQWWRPCGNCAEEYCWRLKLK